MEKNNRKGFKWRGLVTFLLAFGMLVEIVSGIVLYITPPGRFANWTNWTFWGIDKHMWGAIHTVFGYLLLIVIMIHLYFNWRVILHFTWNKLRNTFNLKWELAIAVLISVLVFAGTLWNIPPFSTVMDIGNDAKLSWERNGGNPTLIDGGWARSTHENDVNPELQRGGRWDLSNAYAGQAIDQSGTGVERPVAGARSSEIYYGRGQGRGRDIYKDNNGFYSQERQDKRTAPSETLKGRDYTGLGTMGSVTGTLVSEGNEWRIKAGETLYEIHMGPSDYMADKGLILKDGSEAQVSGFIYKDQISVRKIETEGRSLTLRDETGRPAWARSMYSRGSGTENLGDL